VSSLEGAGKVSVVKVPFGGLVFISIGCVAD
jgi:hypothetical protein